MTVFERVELSLICIAIITANYFAYLLPEHVSLGLTVVWFAVLIFIQSILRDLSALIFKTDQGSQPKEIQCLCLESLVGVSVLLVGFALIFVSSPIPVSLSNVATSGAVFVTLIIGFLIKDLVVTWRPVGLRREKNHMNIIVKW